MTKQIQLFKNFSGDFSNDDNAQMTGYLTTWDNTDSYGDVVKSTAYDDFVNDIKQKNTNIPLFLEHDSQTILGHWLPESFETALLIKSFA